MGAGKLLILVLIPLALLQCPTIAIVCKQEACVCRGATVAVAATAATAATVATVAIVTTATAAAAAATNGPRAPSVPRLRWAGRGSAGAKHNHNNKQRAGGPKVAG